MILENNKYDYYIPEVILYNYSYPFGMPMPGRKSGSQPYRFSFQGQEKDDEIKGQGNSLNYEYRMHDPRIGRFFAVDPASYEYTSYSPYVFVANNPIIYIDPDGRRIYFSAGAAHDPENTGYIEKIINALDIYGGMKNVVDIMAHSNSILDDAWFASNSKWNSIPNKYLYNYSYVEKKIEHPEEIGPYMSYVPYETVRELVMTKIPLDWRIDDNIAKIKADLKANPLAKDEQFNLMGYSTGAVINAQSALILADEGFVIDNLILIAPTIEKTSLLYQEILKHPNIKNVIRIDIEGDDAINGNIFTAVNMIAQGNEHPHFKYATNSNADQYRKELAKQLKDLGVSDNKLKNFKN